MGQPIFKRIVLKVSGEVLAGNLTCGIDGHMLQGLTSQIRDVRDTGVQISVVVGGGNFIRGASRDIPGIDRITADSMGMLATIINALALKSSLQVQGLSSRVFSAIPVEGMAESFDQRNAVAHLVEGIPIIFAGGTGHPYFTTDTTAALRAVEIGAEAILKGTKVDGVYTADPFRDPRATKYDRLSFLEVLEKKLNVIDATAAALCMDHHIKLVVFNIRQQDVLKRVVLGEPLGTIVEEREHD